MIAMIEIKNLKKKFNSNEVLRGVNLNIDRGETLVIIGPSGCGKSVLLKHIIGIYSPDEGEVIIDGEDITKMNNKDLYRIRKRFGFQFQGSALFDSMTVGENVGLGLVENTEMKQDEVDRIVKEKLELVGLPGVEDLMPADLSGGMKKRVALARSLATEPDIILYEEPTTGLDPIMSDQIDELIKELSAKLKVTSVVVTHDIFSVYDVADNVALMHEGKIYFHGTPSELISSKDPVIKLFLNRTSKRI